MILLLEVLLLGRHHAKSVVLPPVTLGQADYHLAQLAGLGLRLHEALLKVVNQLAEVVRVLPQLGVLYLEGLCELVVRGLRRRLHTTIRRVLRARSAYLSSYAQESLLGLGKLVLFPEELF